MERNQEPRPKQKTRDEHLQEKGEKYEPNDRKAYNPLNLFTHELMSKTRTTKQLSPKTTI